MGLLSKLGLKKSQQVSPPPPHGYQTYTEHTPAFSSWDGTLYDQLLTRAAVERFASACSKLKPECLGLKGTKPKIRRIFDSWPNSYMTWPRFLANIATIVETDTMGFIIPELDRMGDIVGLDPLKPLYTEVCEYGGEPWYRFHLMTGDTIAMEFDRVCILSKFQYESAYFGSGNDPLDPTLRLMDAQRQAEELAVKNGARIRFIGRVTSLTHEDDLERKRDRFAKSNLSPSNKSGLLVYDQTFDNIQQVNEQRFTLDPEEMARIERSVYAWFGTNEHILQNVFTDDEWNAYYEAKVEPFALQLSEGLTRMLFTATEVGHGNRVMFSSNRMAYASTKMKNEVVSQMTDRGLMTVNEAREIFQLPPIEGGDVMLARGEYKQTNGADAGDTADTQDEPDAEEAEDAPDTE